jgi:DHA1 family bicyclomycin/chloramphenicol resistance-like MFS transporter
MASSIEILIAARFFQAIGGSGTIVLARAVARDLYDGARLARELSRMAAVMALAPLVAPLIGGMLQTVFGWRANFIVLVGFGVGAATLVWLLLPETLRLRAPEPVSFVSILRAYRTFMRNRVFLAHVGIVACGIGGLFAWISTAAFVLQDIYGLSALEFGMAFTASSAGYLVGTWLAAHFVVRMGIDRAIGLGSLGLAAGGLASVLTLGLGFSSATVLVVSMALYLAGLGLALPQAQAGALLPFPERAGAASSLVGFSQQTAGALVGTVVGFLLGQSAWPLTIAVAIMGCLAFALWALTRKLRAGRT